MVFCSAYLISIPITTYFEKDNDLPSGKKNVFIALFFAFLIGGTVDGTTACSGDGYSAPEVTGRTMR
jgi:hypothetical protein